MNSYYYLVLKNGSDTTEHEPSNIIFLCFLIPQILKKDAIYQGPYYEGRESQLYSERKCLHMPFSRGDLEVIVWRDRSHIKSFCSCFSFGYPLGKTSRMLCSCTAGYCCENAFKKILSVRTLGTSSERWNERVGKERNGRTGNASGAKGGVEARAEREGRCKSEIRK